jgi:multimeric flavodoxin WrbA
MARTPKVKVRKGQPDASLSRAEFTERFRSRFKDPAFRSVSQELDAVIDIAWQAYRDYHKDATTRRAGRGFQDPDFELSVEWLQARAAVRAAEREHRNRRSRSRILVVSASSRSDQSCPGEMSKTFRLARIAERTVRAQRGFEVDFLDLSLMASQYGRVIYPCKACVSTAMPLCNWPCSCYPNQALGQTGDWMNEIYPRWVRAHGVMILTPVNWYQSPSVLKLMMDRLVCADGGNPDPTSTQGKDPELAKQLELRGWDYPKHLAGRAFAVVVHGDAAGVENLRRMLCDWLTDMELIQAGPSAAIDRYVGYYRPYATSHDDLDADRDLQVEVRNAAASLCEQVRQLRSGSWRAPDADLKPARQK